MYRFRIGFLPIATLLIAAQAIAVSIEVPEDYPTIQAALDASVAGDSILIAPGTYYESLTSPSGVTIVGIGGADQTFLDGSETDRVLYGSSLTLIGLTIQNGRASSGAGVSGSGVIEHCVFLSNATFSSNELRGGALSGGFTLRWCRFEGNAAEEAGGAISGSVDASDCVFVRNGARNGWGGAVDGSGTYRNCLFERNSSRSGAAAAYAKYGTMRFEDCVFINHGGNEGGVVRTFGGSVYLIGCVLANNNNPAVQVVAPINGVAFGSVENCTFVDNRFALDAQQGSARIEASRSIFAGNQRVAFRSPGLVVEVGCSDLWMNADNGGYSSEPEPNFSADPLFCDPLSGLYALDAGSPCLPDSGEACGLVGALGLGCGAVDAGKGTTGGLKARYRGRG